MLSAIADAKFKLAILVPVAAEVRYRYSGHYCGDEREAGESVTLDKIFGYGRTEQGGGENIQITLAFRFEQGLVCSRILILMELIFWVYKTRRD